jgi:hypothetical protein
VALRISLWAFFIIAFVLIASAADIPGKWTGTITLMGQTGKITLDLTVDGKALNGTLSIEGKDAKILEGKVDGDAISFGYLSGAHDVPRLEFQGKVDGDEVKLTVTGKAPDGVVYKLGEAIVKRVR